MAEIAARHQEQAEYLIPHQAIKCPARRAEGVEVLEVPDAGDPEIRIAAGVQPLVQTTETVPEIAPLILAPRPLHAIMEQRDRRRMHYAGAGVLAEEAGAAQEHFLETLLRQLTAWSVIVGIGEVRSRGLEANSPRAGRTGRSGAAVSERKHVAVRKPPGTKGAGVAGQTLRAQAFHPPGLAKEQVRRRLIVGLFDHEQPLRLLQPGHQTAAIALRRLRGVRADARGQRGPVERLRMHGRRSLRQPGQNAFLCG